MILIIDNVNSRCILLYKRYLPINSAQTRQNPVVSRFYETALYYSKRFSNVGQTPIMSTVKTQIHTDDPTLRTAAIVAGAGMLIMTIFTVYPYTFIFAPLIEPGDAVATANNLVAQSARFRVGICSYLIVIICDVLVAWALYVFTKPVNPNLSLLMAWFRLVYAVIFGLSLIHYFQVLQLLETADQSSTQIMLSLQSFDDAWAIGFVFFGIHLMLLGYLGINANNVPTILGVLLILVGLGYLIDKFSSFLNPDFATTISSVTGYGEIVFAFWLVWKGGRVSGTKYPKLT